MKFDTLALASLLFFSAPSFALPQPVYDVQLLSEDSAAFNQRDADVIVGTEELWKRKGGGGGGGKGGGSSGGKGGSSSSGSTSSSSSSSGKSSGKGSSTSSAGGSTKQGSGVQPTFGGGRYYSGGATSPYASGLRSPLGITPFFIGGAALAVYPGIWLYGAYSYPYNHTYTFKNISANANDTSNVNSTTPTNTTNARRELWTRQDQGFEQTKPVTCLCAAYQECGCDDSGNTTFLDSLIGDGTYSQLNLTLVNVADVNGTSTILLNGTLPNGTTIPGGTEDANHAGAGMRGLMQSSGYLVMVALAACTVLLV